MHMSAIIIGVGPGGQGSHGPPRFYKLSIAIRFFMQFNFCAPNAKTSFTHSDSSTIIASTYLVSTYLQTRLVLSSLSSHQSEEWDMSLFCLQHSTSRWSLCRSNGFIVYMGNTNDLNEMVCNTQSHSGDVVANSLIKWVHSVWVLPIKAASPTSMSWIQTVVALLVHLSIYNNMINWLHKFTLSTLSFKGKCKSFFSRLAIFIHWQVIFY